MKKNKIEKQIELVKADPYNVQFIKKPNEIIKLLVVQQDGFLIKFINKPSEEIQINAINNISNIGHYFMDYCYQKINSSKALNLLYKKAPHSLKDKIKSHPNYKTDAQLILTAVDKK